MPRSSPTRVRRASRRRMPRPQQTARTPALRRGKLPSPLRAMTPQTRAARARPPLPSLPCVRARRLNAIVPNSKWVRVETDADECYVLGVLFDLSLPIFICYGVPGKRSLPPPREIADAAVWLPLAEDSPDGFWVIYQSAADGKCVT